jgi:phosphonate transport system permease protein
MPVKREAEQLVWQRRTTARQWAIWAAWFAAALLVVQCWRLMSENTIWEFVWDAPAQAADLFTRMVPPAWPYIDKLWGPLWDTINIATLGTLLGIVLAVPVAYCAAHNTSPSPRLLRPLALLVIVSSRSINSLIWALLLVSMFGPGLLAGIVAIALRSIGFIAKLTYEALEEIDPTQVEAIAATGASKAQIVGYGMVPQIMPAFAGMSVFRWDINIRESTVLGLVGAGGIGLELKVAMDLFQYDQAATIILAIFALVLMVEETSGWIRRRLI